jgi:hypothetical protein
MANAFNHTRYRWQHFHVLEFVLDFTLDGLGDLKGFE